MTTRPDAATLEALKRCGAATIHESQGQRGAVDPGIKPLSSAMRVVGPALTVKCKPGDNLVLHYALVKAQPGDVLVVDYEGFSSSGPWGDVMTLAAQTRGIAGLCIDGTVRDSTSIVEMGFPVFSRGACIKGTNKYQPGAVGIPLVFGGVLVNPGDIVVGDGDGLVVIDQREVAAVLAAAEAREAKEEGVRKRIRAGTTTVEILGVQDLLAKYGMT